MVNDDGVTVLPDGSAFCVGSMPLPKYHWLYEECGEPPMPWRIGVGVQRDAKAKQIAEAVRYAVRASTRSGKESDFDPDAMVQNVIVGLLGYWTPSGGSEPDEDAAPSAGDEELLVLLRRAAAAAERQANALEKLSKDFYDLTNGHGVVFVRKAED